MISPAGSYNCRLRAIFIRTNRHTMQTDKNISSLEELLTHNPLYVFALENEAAGEFEGGNLLFVGVGKVSATYTLLKAVMEKRPGLIVNLGSAGSNRHKRGSVVCCTSFIQRDMDATSLGFKPYETPFSGQETVLQYGIKAHGLPEGTCGSGDSFESTHAAQDYDVVDMEAFALAWVAMKEEIPFLCLKYISDEANSDAAMDWQETVGLAANALKEALQKIKA
jgi:adenosylhomocysteine nucleosidase